jgi:hypothetical protein
MAADRHGFADPMTFVRLLPLVARPHHLGPQRLVADGRLI